MVLFHSVLGSKDGEVSFFAYVVELFCEFCAIGVSGFRDCLRVAIPKMCTESDEVRRGFGRGMNAVIVSEFGNREPVAPIGFLIIYVEAKVSFNFLVNAFGLTIGLWVVSGGRSTFDSTRGIEVFDEIGDELGSSV